MSQISVYDAKNRLSALLDQVERGEGEVTITRRGKPVARLVPASSVKPSQGAAERLLALRARIAARGESFSPEQLQAYRDEGRT